MKEDDEDGEDEASSSSICKANAGLNAFRVI